MHVTILFRGATHPVEVAPQDTVGELLRRTHALLEAFDLERDTMKLVCKGKALNQPHATLADCGVDNGDKVLLAASSKSSLEAVKPSKPERIIDDLTASLPAVKAAPKSYGPTSRTDGSRKYGFGAIVTLPGFRDESAAYDVLYRVATHPGVLGVMKAHRWFVPVLAEMYPDGKVGVDPVCVLGLNTNKGQQISLRIRTDDLLGYRKSETIMKTVYHELAHNELSEHTGEFYDLVSALSAEGAHLDWTKGEAHRLGDGEFHKTDGVTIALNSRYSARQRGITGATSGAVGGDRPDPAASPAALAALAAQARRATGPEQDAGTRPVEVEPPPAAPVTSPPAVETPDEAMLPRAGEDAQASMPSSPSANDGKLDVGSAASDAKGVAPAAQAQASSPPSAPSAPSAPIDEDSAEEALSGLVADCLTRSHSVREALTTLHGVLSKVLGVISGEEPDAAKYLRLRPSNPAFQRRTASSDHAVRFLVNAGFRTADSPGDSGWLSFPVDDEASLSRLFAAFVLLQDALAEFAGLAS